MLKYLKITVKERFSQVGVVPLLSYKELDTIYTDEKISDETVKILTDKSVCVITTDLLGVVPRRSAVN